MWIFKYCKPEFLSISLFSKWFNIVSQKYILIIEKLLYSATYTYLNQKTLPGLQEQHVDHEAAE